MKTGWKVYAAGVWDFCTTLVPIYFATVGQSTFAANIVWFSVILLSFPLALLVIDSAAAHRVGRQNAERQRKNGTLPPEWTAHAIGTASVFLLAAYGWWWSAFAYLMFVGLKLKSREEIE